MLLRTKLVIAYSTLVVSVVGGLLLISDFALEDLTRRNLDGADRALSEITQANYRLAENILSRNGEQFVASVARSAASELSLLLARRTDLHNYAALRADQRLRAAANRDLHALDRVAGYTDVLDRDGVSVWHPNPAVEGRNFSEWRRRYPEMWALVARAFSEPEVRGYYSFLDRDNRGRRKYMVLCQVPDTRFIVAAVVNIEDFFLPVQREIEAAGQQARATMAAQVAAGAEAERRRMKGGLFAAGAVAMAAAVLLAFWLARFVARPLARLRDGVIRLGCGDFAVEVPENGSGEVRELAQAFNRLGGELARYTARLAEEATAREALDSEIRIARRIQESMLPGADSPCLTRSEYELHGANREAREVGGDFYDFFPLADERMALLIADVSGKGIPAALFMAVSRTLLKDACQRGGDPAQALAEANRALSQGNDACMFVTVFLAFYDIAGGGLDYANGGHPQPWLLRATGEREVFGCLGDPILGIQPEHVFHGGHVQLQPGDTLFLYTDGVSEAMSPAGEAYGADRLERLLAETAALPTVDMGRRIVAALDAYQQGVPFDDITLLILRRKPAAADSRAELDLTLRNSRDELPRLAEQVAALAARAGLSSLVAHRLNLVLEEIIGNTLAYGYPDGGEHALRVRLAVLADAIEVEIRDDARPFDPLADRPAPYLGDDLDRRQPGGLGLHLVRRLVRNGKYVTEAGNNCLSLKMDKEVDKAEVDNAPLCPTLADGEIADGS